MSSFFFSHFDHFTDSRTPWTSDQLVTRPLPKHWTTHTHTKHPCLCVGFEPTIPASERAKTVHALDRAATVTGFHCSYGDTVREIGAINTWRSYIFLYRVCQMRNSPRPPVKHMDGRYETHTVCWSNPPFCAIVESDDAMAHHPELYCLSL
jgi:hypothetical protein